MKKNDILSTMAYALSEAIDGEIRQAKWEEADRIRKLIGMETYVISVRGDGEYYPNVIAWSNTPLFVGGEYQKADLLEMIEKGALIFLNNFKQISSLD